MLTEVSSRPKVELSEDNALRVLDYDYPEFTEDSKIGDILDISMSNNTGKHNGISQLFFHIVNISTILLI